MTDNGGGLNRNVLREQFPTSNTGSNETIYATEFSVDQKIKNNLSELDLNISIGSGLCYNSISSFTGDINTLISVGLSAGIQELNNVNIDVPTLIPDQSTLVWTGTCWENKDGPSIAKIENLPYVYNPGTVPGNNFLKTNSDGTCVIFENVSFVDTVLAREGCINLGSDTSPLIGTDLTTITQTTNDDEENFFAITTRDPTSYQQKMIRKNNISLDTFNNNSSQFLSLKNFGVSTFPNSSVGSSVASGPSGVTVVMDFTDFVTTADGILPLAKGGTSSSTSAGARSVLGLCIANHTDFIYNETPNIIGYETGLFNSFLTGDSLRIISPGISTITIKNGGTSYDNGTCSSGSFQLTAAQTGLLSQNIGVSTFASGGSILGVSALGPSGFPFVYSDSLLTDIKLDEPGTSGVSAIIDLHLHDSYISFGQSTGLGGVGFRFTPNNDRLHVNNGTCSVLENGWEVINQPPIGNLHDVDITGPGVSQILIYDDSDSRWKNKNITGQVTLDKLGNTTVTGISAPAIGVCPAITGGAPITEEEFSSLSGMNTTSPENTIQKQLDNKFTLCAGYSVAEGDLLYVSSAGTCFLARLGLTNDKDVLMSTSLNAPEYKNVFHAFKNESTFSDGTCFCVLSGGSAIALRKAEFNNYLISDSTSIGPSAGLNTDLSGTLIIDTTATSSTSSVHNYNTLLLGTSLSLGSSPVQNINIADFLTGIAGNGLSQSSGQLDFNVPVYGTSSQYPGYPNFTTGSIGYFYQATKPGTSVLAVYDGSDWYGVSMTPVTF